MRKVINKILPSRQLTIVLGVLCVLGTMNIFSSGTILSLREYHTPYHFVTIHLIALVLGLIVCWVVMNIDYHYWNDKKIVFGIIAISVVLLILVKLVGINVNGSVRWIRLGPVQFQPSEFVKLAALIIGAYGANFVRARGYDISFHNLKFDRRNWIAASWPFAIILFLAAWVETQPDLGTAGIIFLVGFTQYIIGTTVSLKGFCKWFIPLIGTFGSLYVFLAKNNFGYRFNRLTVWWDPWGDAKNFGYQMVQSLMAIGSGGVFGLGYGEGFSKFGDLPEAHTDFAVAILAQEYGLVGIIFLTAVMFALLWILVKVALTTKDYFGKMIIIGGIILLVGQGIINMAMVAGILPVVGVPFPFVSYGGTSLILNFIVIGLMFSVILRDEAIMKAQQRKAKELARRKAHEEQKAALRAKLYKMD